MFLHTHFPRQLSCTALLCLALSFPSIAAQAQAQTKPASPSVDYIVAIVDSVPITNHEVRERAAQMRQKRLNAQQAVPAQAALLKEALDTLITEKALLQFAKDSNVEVDGNGLNADQRDQAILQKLIDRNVPSRIKVSDADIDALIQERQSEMSQTNPDIELAHILVPVPEHASPEDIARLQALAQSTLERLKHGESFASVAKEVSASPEREHGGLMGLRAADRYPTLFAEAALPLKVGEFSPVLRSGAGFHILKLVQKKLNTQLTITETHVRHILLRPSSQLSTSAARGRLAEFKRQIEAGKADFGQLAQANSQDASASSGGDLGWATPGMFVPEFEEAMKLLKPGQIADPVVSRFGVHLLQVLARRDMPLSERDMREMARNQVRERKFGSTYELWSQEIRDHTFIEYRDPPQ